MSLCISQPRIEEKREQWLAEDNKQANSLSESLTAVSSSACIPFLRPFIFSLCLIDLNWFRLAYYEQMFMSCISYDKFTFSLFLLFIYFFRWSENSIDNIKLKFIHTNSYNFTYSNIWIMQLRSITGISISNQTLLTEIIKPSGATFLNHEYVNGCKMIVTFSTEHCMWIFS